MPPTYTVPRALEPFELPVTAFAPSSLLLDPSPFPDWIAVRAAKTQPTRCYTTTANGAYDRSDDALPSCEGEPHLLRLSVAARRYPVRLGQSPRAT